MNNTKSLPNARNGDAVTWQDSAGHIMTGIALRFERFHLLAGTQDAEVPYVSVPRLAKSGAVHNKLVPNNTIWVVPYASVVANQEASEEDAAA